MDEESLFQKMNIFVQGKVVPEIMGKASRNILLEYTPKKIAEIYYKAIKFIQ